MTMTVERIIFDLTSETTDCGFPNTEYKSCFSNDYDLSPFVKTSSMFSMLLEPESISTLDLFQTNKNSRVNVQPVVTKERQRTWKKYIRNGGSSSSSDSSDSDDCTDSSESVVSPRTSETTNESCERKKSSKNGRTKEKMTMTDDEKRKYVMNLNQEYANQLQLQKELLVESFREWKVKESYRMECSRERKKWAYLNKKYTTMKRRNAREIFDKVQSLNRKLNVPSNVYDLHGQGVKCGNFEYILKRILKNADKKKTTNQEEPIDDKKRTSDVVKGNPTNQLDQTKIILDIGNQKDGEWHDQALESTVSYLSTSSVHYEIDKTNRYVTIYP